MFEHLLSKAVGGPFIGPKGGKWADPEHTIPWHPEGPGRQAAQQELRHSIPPIYHDPKTNDLIATHAPNEGYRPASAMTKKEFAKHWEEARHRPEAHGSRKPEQIHHTEIVRALRHGREVSKAGAKDHDLHHALAAPPKPGPNQPKTEDTSKHMAGGEDWWKAYGWRSHPGWSGEWQDTTKNDPERYDKQGVKWAAKHMLRMRDMRQKGKVPREAIEAIALFAITSVRTTAVAQERAWPKIDAWLAKGDTNDIAGLVDAMRPLGVQNNRAKSFQKCQQAVDAYMEGMQRFGDHGPALRDWLMVHPSLQDAGISNAKISFTLELLGYSNIGCIDARVIQHMTGATGEAATKLASKLSSDGALYAEFEKALARSQSYKEDDPEEIRLGMAQWRMWDAEGGSDTTHKVLWDTMANITGIKAFRKAIAQGFDSGFMSSALSYHEGRLGIAGPGQLDILPSFAQKHRVAMLAKALHVLARTTAKTA